MPQNIRLTDILDLARKQGKVTTDSLARTFGVTVQTARRDLNTLCDEGHLTRVGGVEGISSAAIAVVGQHAGAAGQSPIAVAGAGR